MAKSNSKNLIKKLLDALIYEEKSLIEFQYNCFGQLPGYLNDKELDQVRLILETILSQSLNHSIILGDLIVNFYPAFKTGDISLNELSASTESSQLLKYYKSHKEREKELAKNSNDTLLKSFQDLFVLEERARDIYQDIRNAKANKEITDKILFIKRQEAGHMKLTKSLIKISEKAARRTKKPNIPLATKKHLAIDFLSKKSLLDTIDKVLYAKIQTIVFATSDHKKRIESGNFAKSHEDFISTIVHQIKTPVTASRWFSELLLREKVGSLTKKQRENLEEVRKANYSLVLLVNDLLDATEVDKKEVVLKKENVDLKSICDIVVDQIQYLIKSKKQRIITGEIEKNLIISCNKNNFKRIIFNLLTNAVQYGREGGEIFIQAIKKNSNKVVIAVSDNGFGIPTKDQKNVFKKFFRASNADKIHSGGTGVGLYLAREMVKRMGGKIWFESKENKGTTFFVELPIK